MNIVAVTPAGPGNLRAFAWDSPAPPAPTAAVLNYGALTALPAIANGIIVPICDPAVSPCVAAGGFDMIIQADVSAVDVVVDVTGYFSLTPPPTTTHIVFFGSTTGTPTFTQTFFRDLGTFTKLGSNTDITATWDGHFRTIGTPGSQFCQLQMRIDGILPDGGDVAGTGAVNYGTQQAASLTGYWTGLSAGSHTVQFFLRGNATSCTLNFGNFPQHVYVGEH
jgi:hypothetical protein